MPDAKRHAPSPDPTRLPDSTRRRGSNELPHANGLETRFDGPVALPLEPLPAGFMRRMRANIEAEALAGRVRPPAAPIWAGPGFVELCVASCLVLTAAAGLGLALWWLGRSDPLWLAELTLALRGRGFALAAGLPLPPRALALLLAAGLGLAGGLVLALDARLPLRPARR